MWVEKEALLKVDADYDRIGTETRQEKPGKEITFWKGGIMKGKKKEGHEIDLRGHPERREMEVKEKEGVEHELHNPGNKNGSKRVRWGIGNCRERGEEGEKCKHEGGLGVGWKRKGCRGPNRMQ